MILKNQKYLENQDKIYLTAYKKNDFGTKNIYLLFWNIIAISFSIPWKNYIKRLNAYFLSIFIDFETLRISSKKKLNLCIHIINKYKCV